MSPLSARGTRPQTDRRRSALAVAEHLKAPLTVQPTLLAILAIALAGCGRDEVADYCSYGAVSQAQLEGCESHVTTDVVEGYDTNAARYAKGELDDCLADAGPFCRPRR